jgi:hypothetical protein
MDVESIKTQVESPAFVFDEGKIARMLRAGRMKVQEPMKGCPNGP